VIVWTYGGGFTGGSGSEPRYDGESLAKKGAVVITYNYRLGTFGFFAHPELSKESGHNASGNYGLMDFAATLRWVQKNIAAFGGDPNRVTIAGESAGAILVADMVGSPEGKGLFLRAIGQSGPFMGASGDLTMGKMRTRVQAEEAGARAAGTNTLAQLRAMSVEQIGQNLRGVEAGVIVDGWMIPEDQSLTFSRGKQNKVDVLLGSNHDEGTFFGNGQGNAEQFQAQARQNYGELVTDFLKLYPASTNEEAGASGLARIRDEFGWYMRTFAQAEAKAGKKAYVYHFTRVAPGQTRGATHTAELTYMFQNPPATGWSDVDHKLADQMSTYWVNFAATGDPNGKGLPSWPVYDAKKNDGQGMVFGDTTQFGPQIEVARLKFFDRVYTGLQAR
jgi:para-nitrobenzyl esterase